MIIVYVGIARLYSANVIYNVGNYSSASVPILLIVLLVVKQSHTDKCTIREYLIIIVKSKEEMQKCCQYVTSM